MAIIIAGGKTSGSCRTIPKKRYFRIIPIVAVQKYFLFTNIGEKNINNTSTIFPAAKLSEVP
jgi:hypothetical protein